MNAIQEIKCDNCQNNQYNVALKRYNCTRFCKDYEKPEAASCEWYDSGNFRSKVDEEDKNMARRIPCYGCAHDAGKKYAYDMHGYKTRKAKDCSKFMHTNVVGFLP